MFEQNQVEEKGLFTFYREQAEIQEKMKKKRKQQPKQSQSEKKEPILRKKEVKHIVKMKKESKQIFRSRSRLNNDRSKRILNANSVQINKMFNCKTQEQKISKELKPKRKGTKQKNKLKINTEESSVLPEIKMRKATEAVKKVRKQKSLNHFDFTLISSQHKTFMERKEFFLIQMLKKYEKNM